MKKKIIYHNLNFNATPSITNQTIINNLSTLIMIEFAYKNLYDKDQQFKIIFLSGIVVAIFLNIFQPFGINNGGFCLKGILMVSGYGLMASIGLAAMVISSKVFKRLYYMHPILFGLSALVFISILVYSYFILIFSGNSINDSFVEVLLNTLIVGSVMLFLVKGVLGSSSENDDTNGQKIIIPSRYKTESGIQLLPDQMIMIEANGNYIMVYYLHESIVKKKMIRNTMKEAQQQCTGYQHLMRCHASFLINADYIMEMLKSNRNHYLHLTLMDKRIPVSQKYYRPLKNAIGLIRP